MRLQDLIHISNQVAATSKRTAKIAHIGDLLRSASPEEIPIAVAYLSGELRQRKTNVGWAPPQAATPAEPAQSVTLSLVEVDSAFQAITDVPQGSGSNRQREALLRELMARTTAQERDFIFRLVAGELRQGALE